MDSSNPLGKLKSIASKRRRKKQSDAGADWSSDDVPARGRSATSREGTESDDTNSHHVGESEENSLASYESDPESPEVSSRPSAISSHPSQIGYLTTNSPLVQAEHFQSSQSSDLQDTDRTATFSAETADLESVLPAAPSKAALAPPHTQNRRSTSPVGRIREAFRSKKHSAGSSGTGSPSPERRPTTSDAEHLPESQRSTEVSSRPNSIQSLEEPTASKASSSGRFRSLSKGQRIDTSAPPRTPPGSDHTPVIVNTPPTPTDPNHPQPRSTDSRDLPNAGSPAGNAKTPPPGNMIAQRRGRAASTSLGPSKLSNITPAPLTPTAESEATTPSNQTSGFFTSMISAAQNAANTFSNTITNTNIGAGNKSRATTPKDQDPQADDNIEVEPSIEAPANEDMDSKEPAVKTLGMGDLSLSQLGLVEPSSTAVTPTKSRFPERSESRARSESAPVDVTPVAAEAPIDDFDPRPRSLYEPAGTGERTPPTGSVYEGKSGVQRSGSIRSAIGRHRKRGSSAATGGTSGTGMTIGAAIAAANASVAHPSAQAGGAPKLTGFAVASKKRNRDFHALFKSVPDDDYLIEDYSCALQREILAHGRLYVSEGHLCFSSNILGWVTTLVMSFDEIVSVEKRSTALVFKNGLMISTLHAKHIFASFTSRDSTYDLIVKIWKLGHPSLQSSLNGVRLEETGGDKTEKIDADSMVGGSQSGSDSEDDSEDGDDVYDEDEENDDTAEVSQPFEAASQEPEAEKAVARKASGAAMINGAAAEKPKDSAAPPSVQDFPGPATHAPTECGDAETHYDKIIGDDIIPAPLGKVYDLLFGPASVTWMAKWLTNEQKCTDLQLEDKQGLGKDNKSRVLTYIKPLGGSIGPKQTKCIVTEQLENIDLEKAVNILATTRNPDVPSGNIFSVKTKYCLSWAENNSTRIQANCTIEWAGKSWLKGPIEKGANEGQTTYCKELFASLKLAVSSRPRSATVTNGATQKSKKKNKKGKSTQASTPTSDNEESTKPLVKKKDWGIFEPVHGILGPIVDILKPLFTGNIVYGILVGLLVATWFGFGFTGQSARPYGQDVGFYSYPERLAAYEEMWRREESELWEWLDERVGIDRLNEGTVHTRKKAVEPRTMEEKLREERMDEREIREAIKVTEEKLKVLQSVMDKKQEQPAGGERQTSPSAKIPSESA